MCETITLPVCNHGLPYNATRMPNFLGHVTQREAADYSTTWHLMLQSTCHVHVRAFVCAILTPECRHGDVDFTPLK